MNTTNTQLGVVYGMPAEQYHLTPAMSNSALSALHTSPRHYWAGYLNPARPAREETAAMAAGTLAHCRILEPDAVAERYAVKPAGLDGRTKEGRAWAAEQAGRVVVSADQMIAADAQIEAVLSVPELAALLSSGQPEVSCFWVDPATGVHCKCRVDWVHTLPDGRAILLDLKTTADASPAGFGRSVWNYGYHRQDAWYSRGFALAGGAEVVGFVFAAVTSAYPFIAQAYMLDDEARAKGDEQIATLMRAYTECCASNHWPAYGSGVQPLSLPAWAK
jgi:exodeoxyribonuclease VIII